MGLRDEQLLRGAPFRMTGAEGDVEAEIVVKKRS
jgi:hypothetical protein